MNLDHLAQLATEATKGDWACGEDAEVYAQDGWVAACNTEADAAFIAAANPQTISVLVEVARAAQKVSESGCSRFPATVRGCGVCAKCRLRDALAKLDNLGEP